MKISNLNGGSWYTTPSAVHQDETGQVWLDTDYEVQPARFAVGEHRDHGRQRSARVELTPAGPVVTLENRNDLRVRTGHGSSDVKVAKLSRPPTSLEALAARLDAVEKQLAGRAPEPAPRYDDDPGQHPEIYRRWRQLLDPRLERQVIQGTWGRLNTGQRQFWRQLEENGQ
jgi:hypothetical protein